MHKKRFHLFKEASKKLKRIFRARSVIIVSDHKLDHMPLSGTMQVLILVGVLGFFSGISYLTGSYMNARVVIREKEKTIAKTRVEKTRVNEEMALLKRDLSNFSKNTKELADGNKYLADHYAGLNFGASQDKTNGLNPLFSQGSDKLSLRVAYLESRMKQMRDENDQLITAIRNRTDKKIELFEDIIAMTGLDSEKLEHDATAKISSNKRESTAASATDEPTPKTAPRSKENQGGPFVPFSQTFENEASNELLANVDRLVLLHDIIEQLPLSNPMNNAQMTGGFGRRVDPINGRLAIHPGVDLAGPMNNPVTSTSAGTVVFAGRRAAYGNAVEIEHGFGIVTRYAHLNKIIAKEGTKVRKGQLIGLEGSTGRSTGPHLHYEVRIDDHPVNPVKFLEAGEYVSEK